MKLRFRTVLAALVAATAVSPALAQQGGQDSAAAPPDIGFVNLGRVFRESEFVTRTREAAAAEFSEKEKELASLLEEFKRLDEQREQDSDDSEAAERLRELERKIKRDNRDLTEDKRSRFDEVNRKIEIRIGEKIRDVAGSRRLYLVFELSAVLFADRTLDITDEVIEALDVEPEKTTAEQGNAESKQ